ncbi:MAG: DNA phosphorothioation-associated protein 4 [Verrucomicrobiales bacterium]|nr:DNA phosphorothioation-associated protein 4 [Verrucomicrobiales bacterium]
MIDRRINIPKAHAELIESLLDDKESDSNGPFPTKASVLAFAAALGASRGDPVPFSETSGDPIRKSVFAKAGFESLIELLAVANTGDPNVLSNSDDMEEKRASIFEGYANAGLAEIQDNLLAGGNIIDEILQVLQRERVGIDDGQSDLDISSLL